MFSEFSPGCAIWLPNGNFVYSLLSEKIREFNLENGYVEVRTPLIYKSDLFKTSGHWKRKPADVGRIVNFSNCGRRKLPQAVIHTKPSRKEAQKHKKYKRPGDLSPADLELRIEEIRGKYER